MVIDNKERNGRRVDKLNSFIISVAAILGVVIYIFLPSNIVERIIISIFSPFVVYNVLSFIIKFLVSNVSFFLKLYWGEDYIDGIWTYEYEIDGEKRYGVNRIDQDIYGVRFYGCGIVPNGTPLGEKRSDVRSVSEGRFFGEGTIEFLNKRKDFNVGNVGVCDDDTYYYSRTTFTIDGPNDIQAETVVFGGKKDGNVHKDCKLTKQKVKTVTEARTLLIKNIIVAEKLNLT